MDKQKNEISKLKEQIEKLKQEKEFWKKRYDADLKFYEEIVEMITGGENGGK